MSNIAWNNLDTLESFKKLQALKGCVSVAKELSGADAAKRVAEYSIPMADGLVYNYAAKQVNSKIISIFEELVKESQLLEKFEALYNGDVINTGEKRMVLHQLLRGQLGKDVVADGVNKRDFYINEQKKIAAFADKVHSGKIVNEKGEEFTSVCQIGIGGSDLGPRAIYLALENWAKQTGNFKMDAHFISNVDPDDAASVLQSIDLSKTIFILVPSKHMIAVTSETSPLAKSPDYLEAFFMDDYIGGRYSSSSGVGGAILSLAFGSSVFDDFLKGAAEEDKLATEKDVRKNAALMDALIGVYERNVQEYPSTAVLPYSQALSRFPAHLQQLDMESNGKSVNRFGEKINYVTGPVIFGEPGTNGQHSFYQLLHQGTNIIPLQFIAFKENQTGKDVVIQYSTSQTKLCANVVAQIVAFACGKNDENPNKFFAGERPSSLIYGKQVSPKTIGALLAHYENKVMFQGFLWNVNSFDQEGVQLGKTLAKSVLSGKMEGALKAYADLLIK